MKSVIAYVPALHSGYIQFFKKNGGEDAVLYVLDRSLLDEEPRLYRDMRALSPEEAVKAISPLGYFKDVKILGLENLEEVKSLKAEKIMPKEEISLTVAKKYFKDDVVFDDSIFLRWDRDRAVLEKEVPCDRTVSYEGLVKEMMDKAGEEAEKSPDWWRQVGAVLVFENEIRDRSYNTHKPSDYSLYVVGDSRSNFDAGERIELVTSIHAEAAIVAKAALEGKSMKGAELYVTTFPCPTCAKLLSGTGIKRIFFRDGYSLLDAYDVLHDAGIEVVLVK